MFLEARCKCEHCEGETETRGSDCKYAAVPDSAAYLVSTYTRYVVHGNTPLLALPRWVAEVGDLYQDYRNRRERKQLLDLEEKREARRLLKQYGML